MEWPPRLQLRSGQPQQAWNRAKYTDLANFCPDNLPELAQAVRDSLEHTKSQQSRLRSCFEVGGLRL
jgi:ferritin-like metal-binding protein YciE